ncbi:MlaD family protein [Roseivirga sp.]|uniref:MlaD family protein n=1 Tax=Roseivirga sp. TaxID=1964215 RepID=UPI002B27A5DB|nr:MlaD family protein [Roseivirga sp.]
MAKGREFKVGLFAVLMLGSLYIGFNYLRGLDVFSPLNTYYVTYSNISGLSKGDRVILNGLNVGTVLERKFSSDTYNEILVTLAIDNTIKMKEGTVARLAKPDILGALEVQLILNPNGERVLQSGDFLGGEMDRGIAEMITEEGLSAANSLTSVVNKINDVLEPFASRADTIALAIDNFKYFSDKLVYMTDSVNVAMEQIKLRIDYVTDSMVAAMGGVTPLLAEYTKLGEKMNAIDIESRLMRMDSVLLGTQEFMSKLNSNEGTLGKLMTNDSLYNALNSSMTDLDSLFIDLRENPKRYVHFSIFGRKNRPPADKKKK